MSDTKVIEDVVESKVEETKVEVETPETEESKKIKAILKDNAKQREEIRLLKEQFAGFDALKAELDASKAEKAQEQRTKAINTALDGAKITDEKSRKLAISLIGDSEDIDATIKTIVEEYPLLTGKTQVVLPDTGKASAKEAPANPNSWLSEGVSAALTDLRK